MTQAPPAARREQTGIVALPPTFHSCLGCGRTVAPDAVTTDLVHAEASGRDGVPDSANPAMRRPVPLVFARCPDCLALHRRADELVAASPALAARLGDKNARHQVECALTGLAALGGRAAEEELGRLDSSTTTTTLVALVRHLAVPGGTVRWMTRFVPVLAADAVLDTANAVPWGHASDAQRRALQDGYGALLAERVAGSAPDRRIPPPADSGLAACLVCGLSHVLVSAAQVNRLGGEAAAALAIWEAASLPLRSGRVHGHLCPGCADARESVGSIGPTMAEHSLLAHLDATGRAETAQRLRITFGDEFHTPLPMFAAMVAHRPGTAPTAEPWGWLSLSAV